MYVPGRFAPQLTMIQTSVSTDFYFTFYVHAQSVRKFKRVEERVRDDGRTLVGDAGLQETTDHLRPKDAPVFVAQLDHVAPSVRRCARLHSHVELS